MKITKRQLKRIIKEELNSVLGEEWGEEGDEWADPAAEPWGDEDDEYDQEQWDVEPAVGLPDVPVTSSKGQGAFRRKINTMHKNGEIDKNTWRQARRALSNHGIASAKRVLKSAPSVTGGPTTRVSDDW